MDKQELQKLWEDPANWTPFYYHCAKDPRLIVLKRQKWRGWTINAAHGWKAIFVLIGALVVAMSGPALLVAAKGFHFSQYDVFQATFASIALMLVFCVFFARPPRV